MEDIKIAGSRMHDALKKHAVDKAGFQITEMETHEFNVEGGEFTLFRTLYDNSLNLTVYHENKKGSIATNKLDGASIDAAVEGALTAAEAGIADEAYAIAPDQGKKCFHDNGYEGDMERLFERTRELMADIERRYPKILVDQMIVRHRKIHSLYANTNGTECEVFKGKYTVSLSFAGHEGEVTTSMSSADVITDNLDRPFLELGLMEEKLKDAEAQLVTKPLEGKFEGVIVLTPDSLGSFLYDIMTTFAGDSGILEKTSLWYDKLNQKVADERLNLSVNPSDSRIVEKDHITADGFWEEDYDMIKDGVLKSFMVSLYVANKSGFEREKNSSFSVIIEGGDTPYEEMLKGIKRGLIVGRFSGGRPGSSGDFSGVAKNSFLIEDGKITDAVSETMISGNLAKMLMNIVDISRETVSSGADVLPYIAFDGIVISGK